MSKYYYIVTLAKAGDNLSEGGLASYVYSDSPSSLDTYQEVQRRFPGHDVVYLLGPYSKGGVPVDPVDVLC